MNFFVFLGLNGYLFGREYFEVVALRRLDRRRPGRCAQRFAGRVFLGGVAIAGLFAVPIVNLVAPVIATAFMVHMFEGLRRSSRGSRPRDPARAAPSPAPQRNLMGCPIHVQPEKTRDRGSQDGRRA